MQIAYKVLEFREGKNLNMTLSLFHFFSYYIYLI